MPYTALQQHRLDSGLCFRCGKPRLGAEVTKWYCAACSEKLRVTANAGYARRKAALTEEEIAAKAARRHAYRTALYAAQKQARLCTRCGQATTGAERLARALLCAACRRTYKTQCDGYRRKARLDSPYWGDRNGEPLPFGAAVPVGAVRRYKVHIDSGAFAALRELKKRDREARLKKSPGGKNGSGKVEIVYQTSRIVRDALRPWADVQECPTRTASYREMIECEFSFHADAPTVAAIERHKAARGGNLSATICDLLVATANRSTVAIKRNAPRLSAGGGTPDPWDDED